MAADSLLLPPASMELTAKLTMELVSMEFARQLTMRGELGTHGTSFDPTPATLSN